MGAIPLGALVTGFLLIVLVYDTSGGKPSVLEVLKIGGLAAMLGGIFGGTSAVGVLLSRCVHQLLRRPHGR